MFVGRKCLKVTKKGLEYSVFAATARWKFPIQRKLWKLLPFAIIRILWLERNNRIFNSKWRRSNQLFYDTISLWWWWAFCNKIHVPALSQFIFNWASIFNLKKKNDQISPSQFEAHAGFAKRRKPYLHIYTSNGVSLHELSVSLSKGRDLSAKDNDDLCGICADCGDLLLCDGCPRAFHKDCLGQSCIPEGKWFCPYCQNVHKDQSFASNVNALAAGRVSGVDPIEQISKRCIRIVKTPEIEIGGCTLCRILGFSKSGFGPRTIIFCDQCEKEFHVGCLRDYKMVDLQELPKGKWFCCSDCSRINCELQKFVIRGPEELSNSITKLIKIKREAPNSNIEISWRLLNGKLASPESRTLLSKAVAIFHNCFDPIVDAVTGRDLIPCMVYGRNIREQDFGGMFCAVLTVNSSVVSAGLLRIFGQEFAELPLVATSRDYQGQGYFQSLFSCIERLLGYLEVRHLVLPAAEEAETIWTKKFGFQRLSDEQMTKYTKDHQVTIFREAPMLHKLVPKC